jgi:hypothetical protein
VPEPLLYAGDVRLVIDRVGGRRRQSVEPKRTLNLPLESPGAISQLVALTYVETPLGFAASAPPMLSVPTNPHFVGQCLSVEAQERRHFGAVLSEED